MRLRKKWPPKQEIGDGGETIQRWSANWELYDYPGLCLSKLKPSGQSLAGWSFSCPAIVWVEDEQQSGYQHGLILFEHLKGQVFATRLEALQALEVLLELLEADGDLDNQDGCFDGPLSFQRKSENL